ncbi:MULTISPECIES: hypothetical protein [Cupriavidus]
MSSALIICYSYAGLAAAVEASIGFWKKAADREANFSAQEQSQQFAHGAVAVWGRLTDGEQAPATRRGCKPWSTRCGRPKTSEKTPLEAPDDRPHVEFSSLGAGT